MPSKTVATLLTCKFCSIEQTIKCINSRDYSQWACRSCAIKRKWESDDYRKNRPKKQITKRTRSSGVEHKAKLSESLQGRKLSTEHKNHISLAIKEIWKNPNYRQAVTQHLNSPESIELRRNKSKQLWLDGDFAKKYQTDDFRIKMQGITKALWLTSDFRDKIKSTKESADYKNLMKAIQSDPAYIKKLSIAYAKLPRVSSLQKTLYELLDTLGIKYIGESSESEGCVIGPWSFDCAIQLENGKCLLIECQGDWIHSLPHKIVSDKAKATYVAKYLSDTHILKYLWEHQFASHNQVIELIKNWCGISKIDQIDFDFNEIEIKRCKACDYRNFLSAYHYLNNAGRGGAAYGAYLNNKLIALCVFSPMPRQNITIKGYFGDAVRDLSRFCIHPNYHKQNFGSWFISKCLKQLNRCVKIIVSYADNTFNHHGGLYKACGFVLDGYTNPDFWYSSIDGWVMHKKTLYNKAMNLKMKESEYAERFGFRKVFGLRKSRFIKEL